MEQVFKSKIDTWLIFLLLAPVLLILVVTGLASGGGSHLSAGRLVSLVVPLMVGVAVPLWLFFSTSYTVGHDTLTVRCGPVKQVVPIRSITRVVASRTIESAPALSLDRLAIEYGEKQHVVISPKDKIGFLEALAERGVTVKPTSPVMS